MQQVTPMLISISRQKGCGGAFLGQKLAKSLGMMYLDRELVAEIARMLDAPIELVEAHDERSIPLWESMIESLSWSNPWLYDPPAPHVTASQISELEQEAIVKVAAEKSVVIVGRGGSYLLRNNPNHISFFLYASKKWRSQRIQDIYSMSCQEAIKLIDKTDIERSRAKKALTGLDMCDASQYHLCLDTGVLGLDKAEVLMLQYVRARFEINQP